jgi:alpha-L-glutamate ligase-like protein
VFGLASPRRLKKLGIVGMNKRNVVYIAQNNARHLYPRVDDKMLTKVLCAEHDIPVPKLLGVCKYQHHVTGLVDFLKDDSQFVIKPAKGSGGKGILVITGRDGDNFLKPSGAVVTPQDVRSHTSNTLAGLYSLGGRNDAAIIEELVQFTDDFEGFSFEGVPDVRVIVFKGFPVMAMTRLSTRASDGKANLHQGAVGVGIDLASGRAMKAVQHARPITHHPDTGRALDELVIPHWQEVLELAARALEVTELGYLGADIVLDKQRGPLLLELNARPGLAIQVANGKGLDPRIKLADEYSEKGLGYEERVAFSKQRIAAL